MKYLLSAHREGVQLTIVIDAPDARDALAIFESDLACPSDYTVTVIESLGGDNEKNT